MGEWEGRWVGAWVRWVRGDIANDQDRLVTEPTYFTYFTYFIYLNLHRLLLLHLHCILHRLSHFDNAAAED